MDEGKKRQFYIPPVLFKVGDTVFIEAAYFDGISNTVKYSDDLPFKEKTILKGSIVGIQSKFARVKFLVDGKTVKIRKDSLISELNDDMAEFLLPEDTSEALEERPSGLTEPISNNVNLDRYVEDDLVKPKGDSRADAFNSNENEDFSKNSDERSEKSDNLEVEVNYVIPVDLEKDLSDIIVRDKMETIKQSCNQNSVDFKINNDVVLDRSLGNYLEKSEGDLRSDVIANSERENISRNIDGLSEEKDNLEVEVNDVITMGSETDLENIAESIVRTERETINVKCSETNVKFNTINDEIMEIEDLETCEKELPRIQMDEIESVNPKEFYNDQEVHLMKFGKRIFKAKYNTDTNTKTVHGQPIKKGEGRFFITRILKDARAWNEFDVDKMCVGSPILWKLLDVSVLQEIDIPLQGTQSTYPTVLQTKKKKRKESKWQINVKKAKLASGEGYRIIGKKKGKTFTKPKIHLKGPCPPKCRLDCSEEFSNEVRQQILDNYLALANINHKRQYILNLVVEKSKERERKRSDGVDEVKRRNRMASRTYFLQHPEKDDPTQVCQKMFLNTLSIDEKSVRTALRKRTSSGTIQPDSRGKHNNHPNAKILEDQVIEHIQMFQCVESHYVRKDVSYQYLPVELTLAEMHRMYTKWCMQIGYDASSYKFYADVFNKRFNLKFNKPKKDMCDTCTTFTNTPPNLLTSEMRTAQEKHISDKDIARKVKEGIKQLSVIDEGTSGVAFDLEKVLLCPQGPTSAFYYSRRLKNHNFTMTDISTMETSCFIWNEEHAQKGSCEIGSCLRMFLAKKRQKGCNKLHLFSDRCGGQNSNRMVIIALHDAFLEFHYDMVTLNFLVSGHSQNENDNAHSLIERKSRNRVVYTTQQWQTVIQMSFQKNNVTVTPITYKDIIDYKSKTAFPDYTFVLGDKVSEANSDDTDFSKVYWSRIMSICFREENKDIMQFKYDHAEKEFRNVDLKKVPQHGRVSRKKSNIKLVDEKTKMAARQKYKTEPGISQAKKDDLVKLCEKNYIEPQFHTFYENLIVGTNRKDDAEFANNDKKNKNTNL